MRIFGFLLIAMGLLGVAVLALSAQVGMAIRNFYFSIEGPFGSEFPNEPVGYWETLFSPSLLLSAAVVLIGLALVRFARRPA